MFTMLMLNGCSGLYRVFDMSDFFITGKKGNGKSLLAVARMREYLEAGRVVATNLDLRLEHLTLITDKAARVIRVPDKPKAADLELIGKGTESYNEDFNGGLFLDECATWFNARSWNDKDRQHVIDWLVHARKLGWDVYYLVQDFSVVDKQARELFGEHIVYCRRTDRVSVPFLGLIYKFFFGHPLTLPRVHIATVRYGDSRDSIVSDRWVARGSHLFKAYDTKQRFRDNYPHGVFSYLPSWHIRGRHSAHMSGANIMRLTKIYWRRFSRVSSFAFGFGLCLALLVVGLVASGTFQEVTASPVVAPGLAADQRARLQAFKVQSFVALPGKPPVYFLVSDKEKLTSLELAREGFDIQKIDAKSFKVSKGKDYVIIR